MFERPFSQYWETGLQKLLQKNLSEKRWLEKLRRSLGAQMQPKKDAEGARLFIPNCYVAHVSALDAEGRDLEVARAQLYAFLVRSAIRRDLFSYERLRLELRPNPLLQRGVVRAEAAYGQKLYGRCGTAQEEGEQTMVFDRKALPLANACTCAGGLAVLCVRSGVRAGAHAPLGERRVQIGRQDGSGLCVPGAGISRLHAYVCFEGCRHVLYDADSLNGTYVNGMRITSRALLPGDTIRLGDTEIVYEL